MFELINNIVQEINNIKTSVSLMNRPSTPYPHNLQNSFTAEQQYSQETNDEPEEESYEDYSDAEIDVSENDEDEDEDEKVIVSDDDDISVEEISVDEDFVENITTDDSEPVKVESINVIESTEKPIEEKKPDFNKMNLGNLKAYILEQGWVEDASKMKKAQILSLIQERAA